LTGDYVLDASVGVKLFVAEADSEAADRAMAGLAADPPVAIYVPDIFFAECANVLWKYTQRYGYPAEQARQNITALRVLGLRIVPTVDLIAKAFALAGQYGVSVYDGCYAALAQALALPLLTADRPMATKLRPSGITVRLLAEL
jgi:predicted nucleic acid-binding protein